MTTLAYHVATAVAVDVFWLDLVFDNNDDVDVVNATTTDATNFNAARYVDNHPMRRNF